MGKYKREGKRQETMFIQTSSDLGFKDTLGSFKEGDHRRFAYLPIFENPRGILPWFLPITLKLTAAAPLYLYVVDKNFEVVLIGIL